MIKLKGRSRSERGAIAVIFALIVTMLFVLAAFGVDLGNAMNRRKQLQSDADFAALAGGAFLPAPSLTPASGDNAVQAVADYLIRNKVLDDSGAVPPSKAVLATKLVSGSSTDWARYGRVQYGYYDSAGSFQASKNFVTVTAPVTRVNFSLATVIGHDHRDVSAQATAGLFSKGSGSATLPFYAYSGCDWGQQIINHSTSNATAPNLAFASDSNNATVTSPAIGAPNANPQQVALNDTTSVLTVTGTNLTASANVNDKADPGITSLGLFLPDGSNPIEIAPANFLSGSSATQIRFKLPSTAASNDGATFYLRVAKWAGNGPNTNNYTKQWSAVSTNMAYVEVGSATLFCNDDKEAGNFGSLSVFRLDSQNNQTTGWLPLNIALGLDEPNVKLNPYSPLPIPSNACDNGDPNAKQSDDTNSGVLVNCVVTDVGFAQNSATNGFLTGVSGTPGAPGRLTKPSALNTGCGGANGAPPLRNYKGNSINNEVLSCYFTNDTVTVSQVSDQNYNGGNVINPAIFGSPRFFSVPIINNQPANGKKSFPIVDFRYAFLTGENGTATRGHGNAPSYYWDDSDTNGLVLSGNNWGSVKVESFRVVFLNPKAVPPPPGGGTPVPFDGVEGQVYLYH